jgi:predicted ATPase
MISVITGDNASGKTVYLESLYEKYKSSKIITNLKPIVSTSNLELNYELIDDFNGQCDLFFIDVKDGMVEFEDFRYSENLRQIVKLLLFKTDYLLLDEPESGVKSAEISAIAILLSNASKYEDVYVTTHSDTIAATMMHSLYNVIDGKLVKVAYEDTDCI